MIMMTGTFIVEVWECWCLIWVSMARRYWEVKFRRSYNVKLFKMIVGWDILSVLRYNEFKA